MLSVTSPLSIIESPLGDASSQDPTIGLGGVEQHGLAALPRFALKHTHHTHHTIVVDHGILQ